MAAILQQLCFGRDIQGMNAYARQQSGLCVAAYLVGSGSPTASNFTVPNSATNWLAFMSYQAGVNFWVAVGNVINGNARATVPSGTTISTVSTMLNPSGLIVQAGDVISVITDAATGNVGFGIEFYPNQQSI